MSFENKMQWAGSALDKVSRMGCSFWKDPRYSWKEAQQSDHRV